MIKMKKKWLRGGTALALSAVMSLSMAMPVWATNEGELSTGTKIGSGNNATVNYNSLADGKDDKGSEGIGTQDFTHTERTKTTGNDLVNGADTVYVTVNIDTEFKVSIPKKIVLGSSGDVVRKAAESEKQSIKIEDVNLGDYQMLQIYAPETIKIYDENGAPLAHYREVQVKWDSVTNDDYFINYNEGNYKGIQTIDQSTNNSMTAGIHYTGSKIETFTVAPRQGNDIYAGHWVGVLPFTITVTDEADTQTVMDQIP